MFVMCATSLYFCGTVNPFTGGYAYTAISILNISSHKTNVETNDFAQTHTNTFITKATIDEQDLVNLINQTSDSANHRIKEVSINFYNNNEKFALFSIENKNGMLGDGRITKFSNHYLIEISVNLF